MLDCISHWPRASNNSILFKNNPEKYYIIKRPQLLMPSSHAYSSVNPQRSTFTEQQKKNIILKVCGGKGMAGGPLVSRAALMSMRECTRVIRNSTGLRD